MPALELPLDAFDCDLGKFDGKLLDSLNSDLPIRDESPPTKEEFPPICLLSKVR